MPRGSGFINFDRYLAANRPQAESLAAKLAGGVEDAGAGVEQDLAAAQGQFDQGLAAGRLTYDPMQLTAAKASDLAKRQYTGPMALQGLDDLAKRSTDVQQRAGALGTVAGRVATLQGLNKSPMYTLDQAGLDSALAGAAGGSRFDALKAKYGDLLGRTVKAGRDAYDKATAEKASTAAAAGQYGAAIPALKMQEQQVAEVVKREVERKKAIESYRDDDFPAPRMPQYKRDQAEYDRDGLGLRNPTKKPKKSGPVVGGGRYSGIGYGEMDRSTKGL